MALLASIFFHLRHWDISKIPNICREDCLQLEQVWKNPDKFCLMLKHFDYFGPATAGQRQQQNVLWDEQHRKLFSSFYF